MAFATNCSIVLVVLLCWYEKEAKAQDNPCPRLLHVEPRKTNEPDKWYATVTLISDADLSGVWLRLIFDRPSLQLGNWFGEVVTTDNKEYLVKNRNYHLKANTPTPVRFYLKYNPSDPVPNLTGFRLNAKTVCPEGASTTPPPTPSGELQTSNELSSVAAAAPAPTPPTTFVRPGSGGFNIVPPANEEDDYFQGDFSLFARPQNQRPSSAGVSLDVQCGSVVKRARNRRQVNYNYTPYQNYVSAFLNYLQMLQTNANYNYGNNRRYYNTKSSSPTHLQVQPRPLITHGQATKEGEFPWHAALYHTKGIDLAYICGASLISRQHVITVAHCVTRRKTQQTLNPDNLLVYLGKYYLKKWSSPGIQDKQVGAIIPHPQYNSQTYSNDIAIIKLTSVVDYTDYVRPICLWENSPDLVSVLNQAGTVVGWGFDETGKVTEELTQAKMPVVSKETCIYSFPEFYSRFTTSSTFCAGFRNGTSVCNGDSGGGMVFPKPNSNRNNPIWQLRGLVSISVALQNQFRCDATHYVVFTDVAKYLDFIRAAMKA